MPKFNVTFEITTPESAEHGEADSRGFELEDASLREAVDCIGRTAHEADSWPISLACPPRWLTNIDFSENYQTGAREQRSLHIPESVTASSRLRIARLLGVRVNA